MIHVNNLSCAITLILMQWVLSAIAVPLVENKNLQHLRLIEGSMDRSVDPCDDFYNYACGNWPRYRQFNEEYFDTLTLLEYNYDKVVKNILLDQYPNAERLSVYNQSVTDKAFIYYHSCKNTEIEAFKGYFWEIKPGLAMEWPLIDELRAYNRGEYGDVVLKPESVRQFDVFSLLGQVHSYGLNDILLHLDLPGTLNAYGVFGLRAPENRRLSRKFLEAFFEFSQIPHELRKKYREELLETDNRLQAIYMEFSIEPKVETMSYGKLKRSYPYVARFFEMLIPADRTDDQMLVTLNLEYIRYLHGKSWLPMEIRKLCNYFMLKIFQHLKANGVKNCGEALRKRMPLAVDFLYYQHSILPEAVKFHNSTAGIQKELYHHLTEAISTNHFNFSQEQLDVLELNLKRLKITMGNLPQNITHTQVAEFYHHLPDLDVNNYYKNDLLLRKQSVLSHINCPGGISCSPHIGVIPVYIEKDDMVVVPLAALRPPLYHAEYDPVFSISLLGTFIVKALADGLDFKTVAAYSRSRTKRHVCCQAGKCHESDLVGARVSYATYRLEHNAQPNFTDIPWQQLYFLNLAQFFCGRPDGVNFVDRGIHETRLLDIAVNMPEFAEAFQCRRGSQLNPQLKCDSH